MNKYRIWIEYNELNFLTIVIIYYIQFFIVVNRFLLILFINH
jgi:hypothetical protein